MNGLQCAVVNHSMHCDYTPKELPTHSAVCRGEAHLLNQGMHPLLTQSLGSVKPDIVFELITDAQSATPSLGWDNGASVLWLAQVGTSEVSLPEAGK